MSPAVQVAVAVAALLAGGLLTAVGLRGTRRPAGPPSRASTLLAGLFGVGLPVRQRRSRQRLIGLAVAATAAVWLLSGWPMAGLIAGAAVIGVPWLFAAGREERQMIARLDALESWTRRLRDLVRSGHGLVSAIVTSARTAPAAIAADVADLAAELQAGHDPQHALDVFADQLGDFTADEVIASLKLHIGDRGQHLSDLLTAIASSASGQATMRRGVAAKRAEPRFVTRIMTILILIVLALVFADRAYSAPYGVVVGELVLFAAMLVLVGLLAWIRRLTQPGRRTRFLAPAASTSSPAAASATAGVRREVRVS